MLEHYDSLSIPEWAVCAIVYGDFSGLTRKECKQLSYFLEEWPNDRFHIEWGYERYFSNNPAFGLPCQCIDAVIYERVTHKNDHKNDCPAIDGFGCRCIDA